MKAETLYKKYVASTMRPPTRRKILHAAKKHGLLDRYGELDWFFGGYLTREDMQQFQPATGEASPVMQPTNPDDFAQQRAAWKRATFQTA